MNLTGRAVVQKDPRYENRKYLDLCQGEPCILNFPGCTGGTNPDCPSVPCHSNWHDDGKGVWLKAHDHTAVPGCPQCHYQLDHGSAYTTEQKQEVFRLAQRRWWHYVWTHNKVRVA